MWMRRIKQAALILIVLGFYVLVIHRLRAAVVQGWLYPEIALMGKTQNNIKVSLYNPVSIKILLNKEFGHSQTFTYKIPFGLYLVLAVIFFIITEADWIWLMWLFLLHLICFVIETWLLFGGIHGLNFLIEGMDLVNRYLIPAFSFGVVAVAWYSKKRKTENEVQTVPG